MIVGVIGSGSIGPDLAYGFISRLAREDGAKVYLHDIKKEALDAGTARIMEYVRKGLDRGKISKREAAAIERGLIPTLNLSDLADCDYVLEAATESLPIKKVIIGQLEKIVSADCLIGFATSGIPRSQIAAEAKHPERCFVNHPFFPAWRALPMEVVLSDDAALSQRMLDTMKTLGKVPIITADVPCFAADDVFCNYCAEATRIFAEGVATPAQIDQIVNDAIGGGGPFNVMDLTKGNLLNVHCLELMQHGPTGSDWFAPPPLFTVQANTNWHDRKNPGDPTHDDALKKVVLDRILAVVMGRTFFVVDNNICDATSMNWLTQMALGYRAGLLDIAEELGMDRIHDVVTRYAAVNPGFDVPKSIAEKRMPKFYRNILVDRDGDLATVTIQRPEVKNALNALTITELQAVIEELDADASVLGVVLTGFEGALGGADVGDLAAIPSPEAANALCLRGQAVFNRIAAMKKPIVAAVDGPVLGGGAELSMACHGRVVGKNLMMGQPEVNLGLIPGYGGTQRLPRVIGLERALELLRTGRPVRAAEACALGWAHGEPVADPVSAAKALIRQHLSGAVRLAPVEQAPMVVPAELPNVDLGHRSLAIDAILMDVIRRGLVLPLAQGLPIEAEAVGTCSATVDFDIGMKNFMQNGPRVPAAFLNE